MFLVRWFRGSKDKRDKCSVDIETGAFASEISTFSRKSSMCTQQARGSRPNDGIGRSLQRARRRVERRLGRFGIGKGKKKVTGQDDTCGSCKCYVN